METEGYGLGEVDWKLLLNMHASEQGGMNASCEHGLRIHVSVWIQIQIGPARLGYYFLFFIFMYFLCDCWTKTLCPFKCSVHVISCNVGTLQNLLGGKVVIELAVSTSLIIMLSGPKWNLSISVTRFVATIPSWFLVIDNRLAPEFLIEPRTRASNKLPCADMNIKAWKELVSIWEYKTRTLLQRSLPSLYIFLILFALYFLGY